MLPRETIATAQVPGGVELQLIRHGNDHMITLDGNELMSSRAEREQQQQRQRRTPSAAELISTHTLRRGTPPPADESIAALLNLQSEIREGVSHLQGALRHKHVEEVLGTYEQAAPAPWPMRPVEGAWAAASAAANMVTPQQQGAQQLEEAPAARVPFSD